LCLRDLVFTHPIRPSRNNSLPTNPSNKGKISQ
jgi:hypothetical protein